MAKIEPLVKKKRISHMFKISNACEGMLSQHSGTAFDIKKGMPFQHFRTAFDIKNGMPSQHSDTASTDKKGMHNSLPSPYSNKPEVNLAATTYSQKKTLICPSTSRNPDNLAVATYPQKKTKVFSSSGGNQKWPHKKFRCANKSPLMEKSLSEFKQIKRNRNVMKQESHLARLPDSPISEIIKSYLDNNSTNELNPNLNRCSTDKPFHPRNNCSDSAQKTKKFQCNRSSMGESSELKNNTNVSAPKPNFKRSSMNESYQLGNNSNDSTLKTKEPNRKRTTAETFHLKNSNNDSAKKMKKNLLKSSSMDESPQNIGDSAPKIKKLKRSSIDTPVKIDSNDSARKLQQFYEDLEDLKKISMKMSPEVKNSNDSAHKQRSLNLEKVHSFCLDDNTIRKLQIQNDCVTKPSHAINNHTEINVDIKNQCERLIQELKLDLLKQIQVLVRNL